MTEFLADVPVEDFPPIPDGSSKYYFVPTTEVPDILEMQEKDAQQAVYFAHLNPVFEEVKSLEPEGTILSQTPDPGVQLTHNGTVTIEISNGEPPTVILPELIGRTRTEAATILLDLITESEIVISFVFEERVTDPEAWDKVFLTLPPAGTEVGADEVVTIIIGKPPDPG